MSTPGNFSATHARERICTDNSGSQRGRATKLATGPHRPIWRRNSRCCTSRSSDPDQLRGSRCWDWSGWCHSLVTQFIDRTIELAKDVSNLIKRFFGRAHVYLRRPCRDFYRQQVLGTSFLHHNLLRRTEIHAGCNAPAGVSEGPGLA